MFASYRDTRRASLLLDGSISQARSTRCWRRHIGSVSAAAAVFSMQAAALGASVGHVRRSLGRCPVVLPAGRKFPSCGICLQSRPVPSQWCER